MKFSIINTASAKDIIFFLQSIVFTFMTILSTNSYAIEFQFNKVFGRGPTKLQGQMNYPHGLGVDSVNGNVFVMDSLFNRLQKFDANGTFITSWTVSGGLGIAIDQTTHDVYVVSRSQSKVFKFDENGNLLFTIGQNGTSAGEFKSPKDAFVVPGSGDLLVLDSVNKRVQRFDNQGNFLELFNAHPDTIDPYGISVTPDGQYIYISGTKSNKLFKYLINGTFLQKHDLGGYGSEPGQLRWPRNIAISGDSSVFIADTDNERIQKFDSSFNYITQFQGPHNHTDGPFHPRALDINTNTGAIYVAAAYAHRVDKFDLNGNHIKSFGALETEGPVFNNATDINVDKSSQTLLIADTQNHLIKRFSLQGNFITQYGGPNMVDKRLKYLGFPMEIKADTDGGFWGIHQGVLYPDYADFSAGFIRKYDNKGNFLSGFTKSGFKGGMHGLAVDGNNKLVFVADTNNHMIYKFDFSGRELMRFGGFGIQQGKFIKPAGIALDELKQKVYVIDSSNNRVQLFDYTGNFILQWGTSGTSPGQFQFRPNSQCTIDEYGLLYVVDTGNGRIQVFDPLGNFIAETGQNGYGRPFKFAYPASTAAYKHILYVSDTGGKEVEVFNIVYPDTDNDLIADVWEIKYFGTLHRSGELDFDKDGLNDFEESINFTNPTTKDTDNDGIPDNWEVENNLNPLFDDTKKDNDLDGYSNLYEYEHGSSPNNQDSFPSISDYTIYIDSTWTGIKSGTSSEPYASLTDINWISAHSAVAAGNKAIINLKAGSEWNEVLIAENNGSESNPIEIQKYGVGTDPIINGTGNNYVVDLKAMQYISISNINAKGGGAFNWRCNGCDHVNLNGISSTAGVQGILIQNNSTNINIKGFTSMGGTSTSIVLDAKLQTSFNISLNNITIDRAILVKNTTNASFNGIRYIGTPLNAFAVNTGFDGSLNVNNMLYDARGISDRAIFVTNTTNGVLVFTNITIKNTNKQAIYLGNTGELGDGSRFDNITLENCDKNFTINNSTNFSITNYSVDGIVQDPTTY